jgi:AcrR family transcriptional regulator
MEHKPKRRTRERILKAALQLFNRFGEPSITISAIAADVGISHGNLYYHYPSKEKIVEDLFDDFCSEIERTLGTPESRLTNAEDVWLFLHLMFEAIFKYRFLYRDLNDLLSRHRSIETHFRRILDQQRQTAAALMQGLAEAGAMSATPAEIRVLAENMTLIATYWLSFAFVLNPRGEPDGETLTRGIVHILSLAGPYLGPDERALFERLSEKYLAMGGNKHGG